MHLHGLARFSKQALFTHCYTTAIGVSKAQLVVRRSRLEWMVWCDETVIRELARIQHCGDFEEICTSDGRTQHVSSMIVIQATRIWCGQLMPGGIVQWVHTVMTRSGVYLVSTIGVGSGLNSNERRILNFPGYVHSIVLHIRFYSNSVLS